MGAACTELGASANTGSAGRPASNSKVNCGAGVMAANGNGSKSKLPPEVVKRRLDRLWNGRGFRRRCPFGALSGWWGCLDSGFRLHGGPWARLWGGPGRPLAGQEHGGRGVRLGVPELGGGQECLAIPPFTLPQERSGRHVRLDLAPDRPGQLRKGRAGSAGGEVCCPPRSPSVIQIDGCHVISPPRMQRTNATVGIHG